MVEIFARDKNYDTDSYDTSEKCYKGRDEDALETYILEGIRKITEETDLLKMLDIFYEYARELQESIKMLEIDIPIMEEELSQIILCR